MSKIVSRKCEGQPLAVVVKLRTLFDEDARRFSASVTGGDLLPAAAGYVIGYPLFLEMVGHEWRADAERTAAYYALDAAHTGAVHVLMKEAERLGIDSAPLWNYGRVCRELLADEPWKYYVGKYDTWPDCLGYTRMALPDDYRTAIADGEAVLERLNVLHGAALVVEQRVGVALDDSHLCPSRLAEIFHVPADALRARLNRWRATNHAGWIENAERGPRDARFLYQVGEVQPVINAMKASSQTSSKRPAKKTER